MTEDRRMRCLLEQAQAGDEDAKRQVAYYCFEKYRYRLKKLYSIDPAITLEDLEMTFYEVIHKSVEKADGRGDDFYHIGQRGIWYVISELRAVRRRMDQRVSPRPDAEGLDWQERLVDRTEQDFRDGVVSVLTAENIVRVITSAHLKTRTRQALELILHGEIGDPDDIGFNKRLAERMGISPQRASQIVADLRKVAEQE